MIKKWYVGYYKPAADMEIPPVSLSYSEFKEELEKLGLKAVERSGEHYIVVDSEIKWLLATVNKRITQVINVDFYNEIFNDEQVFKELFHLLVNFAQTPIKDRCYEDVT